jgi:hypothetical protein
VTPELKAALWRGSLHALVVSAISFFTLWADPNIGTRTLVSGAVLPGLTILGTRFFGEGFMDSRRAAREALPPGEPKP